MNDGKVFGKNKGALRNAYEIGREFDRSTSQVRARVKFESRVKLNFPFFFSSFVFNCCVKIMYQR